MNQKANIRLIEDAQLLDLLKGNNIEILETEIPSGDSILPIHIGVFGNSARLSDIVPVARKVCDKLSLETLDHAANRGQFMSCRKSCSACCKYLIGLSIPEMYRLRDELTMMDPEFCVRILDNCVASAQTILGNCTPIKESFHNKYDFSEISRWYGSLDLPCPFLIQGLCSIYPLRPLVCREHFVAHPPQWCGTDLSDPFGAVEIPVSVAEVLSEMTAELEQTESEAVMLPMAFLGTDEHLKRSQRTWPAAEMVQVFLDSLEKKTRNTSERPIMSGQEVSSRRG